MYRNCRCCGVELTVVEQQYGDECVSCMESNGILSNGHVLALESIDPVRINHNYKEIV